LSKRTLARTRPRATWTRPPQICLFAGMFRPNEPDTVLSVRCPEPRGTSPSLATQHACLQGKRKDGSDGTRRPGCDHASRQTNLNRLICRCFSLRSDVLSAWLSQSSNRRLGHEWATETCLHGQRHTEREGHDRLSVLGGEATHFDPSLPCASKRCRSLPLVPDRPV